MGRAYLDACRAAATSTAEVAFNVDALGGVHEYYRSFRGEGAGFGAEAASCTEILVYILGSGSLVYLHGPGGAGE